MNKKKKLKYFHSDKEDLFTDFKCSRVYKTLSTFVYSKQVPAATSSSENDPLPGTE